MPIDFPNSPANGATFSTGDKTWQFDGVSWVLVASNASIGNSAITEAKIADGAVTADKIGALAVTTGKIDSNAVTAGKIASNAVTEAKIDASAVTTAKIADANITAAKLAATAAIQPTIVDAKGDLIVGTANDTVARQAVGANGTVLMADSAQTNGIAWSAAQTSYRNRIINGAFDVWQRGTSYTIVSGTYGAADRWIYWHNGSTAGTQTVSRQAFTAGAAPVAGYESAFFQRITTTTIGSGQGVIDTWQRIEGVRTLAGQTVTVSFWAKTSGTFSVTSFLVQNFGSGGSAETTTTFIPTTSTTTGWVRYTGTATLPSLSGKTIGANNFVLLIVRWNSPTNGATFDLWGAQVEAGSVATPFEVEDYSTTLAKCQRYYYKSYSDGTNPGSPVTATYGGLVPTSIVDSGVSTYSPGYFSYPVAMRTSPTLTYYDAAGNLSKFSTLTGGGLARTDNVGAVYSLYTSTSSGFYIALPGAGTWANIMIVAAAEL